MSAALLRRSSRSNARSALLASTVESPSGRKLQRSAHAGACRSRRSTLAGCTDSPGIRHGPATIQPCAIASRRRWEGSTPLVPATAGEAFLQRATR